MNAATPIDRDLALLNDWQRGFPLVERPFAVLADALGTDEADVLARCAALQQAGTISRIGAVFSGGAGGAALLAAMAVAPERLDAVAAIVSAHAGVNHNYAREHRYNLWFVMTGGSAAAVEAAMRALEADTGCAALRLRMLRAYHIDLGFCLADAPRAGEAPRDAGATRPDALDAALAVDAVDRPLAALAEQGLPIVSRPYAAWAERLQGDEADVRARLAAWIEAGVVRRFGCIVRHHELGIAANAMTVFDVPDDMVDAFGAQLALQPGVTLAYRRTRDGDWRHNLFCMVHGESRDAVRGLIDAAIAGAGLAAYHPRVLFSTRRYKQTGARRFRDALPAA